MLSDVWVIQRKRAGTRFKEPDGRRLKTDNISIREKGEKENIFKSHNPMSERLAPLWCLWKFRHGFVHVMRRDEETTILSLTAFFFPLDSFREENVVSSLPSIKSEEGKSEWDREKTSFGRDGKRYMTWRSPSSSVNVLLSWLDTNRCESW